MFLVLLAGILTKGILKGTGFQGWIWSKKRYQGFNLGPGVRLSYRERLEEDYLNLPMKGCVNGGYKGRF